MPDLSPPAETQTRRRFWGASEPPTNRVDMFAVAVAPRAAAGDAPASGSVATLRIYGPIDSWGGYWGVSAQDVASALDSLPADVTEIRVRINSPGGEAWEGMAILNMLRAHRARAVAVVDGIAASAASVIAAGCDETVMSPGTQMMIHDASGAAYGTAATMATAKRFLDSISNSLASIYAEAAGGQDTEWRALMVEETWYTAQEAVDAGLADRVAVVPDAGETSTAGEDDQTAVDIEAPFDRFDLSLFNYAGRERAPAPRIVNRSPQAPAATPASGSVTQEGSTAVAFSDEQLTTLRQLAGVPDDADEATILAALDEAIGETAEPPAAAAPEVPEGMSLVDTATLEALRNDATAGREARDEQRRQQRAQLVEAAVQDGRITPAQRAAWVAKLEAEGESGEQVLAKLAKGLVPVDALGSNGARDLDSDDALYSQLFGEEGAA